MSLTIYPPVSSGSGLPTADLLRSYLAATVTYNNDDTLGDTALSVTVAAGGIYAIEMVVQSDNAVKSIKMDFGGTATITNFIGAWSTASAADMSASGLMGNRVTSAGTDYTQVAFDGTNGVYWFTGTIEVNAAGTFLLRGAQNAADASDTTILRGSSLILTKLN